MLLTSILFFVGSTAGVTLYKRIRQSQKFSNTKAIFETEPQQIATKLSKPDEPQVEKKLQADQEINHYLTVSTTSLVLTTIGALVYSPLTLVSIPLLIYASGYIFNRAYEAVTIEHKISANLIDSILVIGLMTTGYYFATALLYTFYYYSRKLLHKTEDHSRKHLINIFGKQPRSVWIISDGVELEIPFNQLKINDIVVINIGETIPIDGVIHSGVANIDQHILTGESQPIEKGIGKTVFAGTVVLEGQIQIQVEKTGKETTAAQIGKILDKTADFKASMQSYGERIIDKGALPTLVVSAVTLPILGTMSALATLNAGFGYQMRVTAPLSMLNFLTIASKNGILIKDGRSLELLNQVDTVVFDKTGTLTEEQPHVGKIHCCSDIEENELLTYAAAAEYKQTHPIALAILAEVKQRKLNVASVTQAKYEVGYGIKVSVDENVIRVGSVRFMEMEGIPIPPEISILQEEGMEQGHSLVFIALNDQLAGAIELYPTIRPEAKQIIAQLKQRGLSMYIISGDHEQPTRKLAQKLGIENYFAETLPEGKANLIAQLQQEGKVVCFVGDGINDSIALKKSQVSISLRGASTIATDTASIILMDSHLNQLDQLFAIAQEFKINMKNNLNLSIIPGFMCLGGVFFLHFGIVTTILLYDTSLLVGVWNAMSPSLKKRNL
ncbi:MAG: heavy metal translocating P-type ATPase [Gammaproteobacteria bacterium]|nr:MAG: heavy metal translocating P-type ATPase [Gammaproteobacteria bacterium]